MSIGTAGMARGVALALATLLAGCATSGARRPSAEDLLLSASNPQQISALLDSLMALDASRALDAPGVQLSAWQSGIGGQRVDISFRTTGHAYVLVGMVGRDGHVSVLYPNEPGDSHLVRGDRTYRIGNVFAGFAVPPFNSTYSLTRIELREWFENTGYAFAIASDRPLDLEALDQLGWWDTYDFASRVELLAPRLLSYRIAGAIVPRGARYSAKWEQLEQNSGQSTFALVNAYTSGCASAYSSRLLAGAWYDPYAYGLGRECPGFGRPRFVVARAVTPPPPVTPPPVTPAPPDTGRNRDKVIEVIRKARERGASSGNAATGGDEISARLRAHRAEVMRERRWDTARQASGSRDEGAASTSRGRATARSRERREAATSEAPAARENSVRERARERAREDTPRATPRQEAPARSQPRSEPRTEPRSETHVAPAREARPRPADPDR